MPKSVNRSFSRYTEGAIALFSRLIRAARLERKLSTQEVADRIVQVFPEACFSRSKRRI
jgi:hypothetical protein